MALPLQKGYSKWFGKISVHVSVSVCLVTPLYLENWTLLDFHTWRVYTPPKWQERALTNIFSTILEAIKKGKKTTMCGFFESSRLILHLMKHEFYITGCLNDSSFQQSKFKSLNMYTLKVMKLTKVSWNTLPIIIAQLGEGGSCNIQLLYILYELLGDLDRILILNEHISLMTTGISSELLFQAYTNMLVLTVYNWEMDNWWHELLKTYTQIIE